MHSMTEGPERAERSAMKAATSVREPSIAHALDLIDNATAVLAEQIGRADDRLQRLTERIAVVVGPEYPHPSELHPSADEVGRPESSPMAFNLEIKAESVLTLAREVAKLADRLDDIADRVEL